MKNINLGATFLFLSILCSIKIERLLFLKFLKSLAFFDSYFWPFNKPHEKIIAIFVISTIMASIWKVFHQIPLKWSKTYYKYIVHIWEKKNHNCMYVFQYCLVYNLILYRYVKLKPLCYLTLLTLLRIPFLGRIGSISYVLPIRQNIDILNRDIRVAWLRRPYSILILVAVGHGWGQIKDTLI